MDESLLELENELKRLSPRRLSPGLLAALDHDLADTRSAGPVVAAPRYSTATTLRSWKWASWSLAGAAAVILAAYLLRPPVKPGVQSPGSALVQVEPAVPVPSLPTPAGSVAANRYEPVQATTVFYDLQESAPTMLPDRSEGREVRYRFVDTYTWKNPATNASVRWSLPRDEVRLVRANLD